MAKEKNSDWELKAMKSFTSERSFFSVGVAMLVTFCHYNKMPEIINL
jgi:hypothetical protein